MIYKFLEKLHSKILFWLGFGNPDIETNGEKKVLEYINSKYDEKITVFDVGANVGDYAKIVKKTMPKAEVYLFEPQKKLFEELSKNFKNCFNFGFSDRKEIMPMYGNENKHGLASLYKRNLKHFNLSLKEQEIVNLTTIDSFCDEYGIAKIHFLKIDVEGHELKVLQGAKRMLNNINFIQFEFGGCNIDSRTFFQDFWYLLSDRYGIYRITKSGLKEIKNYSERDEIFLTSNYLAEKKIYSSMSKLSIIIPCYNEEKTVGVVVKRVSEVPFAPWQREIIVVNDGSTDNTANVLKTVPEGVIVINMPKNGGKGSAVRAGLNTATGDYAIIQDADLECFPEDIPSLLKPLDSKKSGEKIAVIGSRELDKTKQIGKSQIFSRLGSLSITKLINLLYGSSLTDALMGYKLFPRVTFSYFNAGRFEAEMIFITRLLKEGYRIVEVPVSYSPRKDDAGKKIRYRDGLKIIIRILRFWVTGR